MRSRNFPFSNVHLNWYCCRVESKDTLKSIFTEDLHRIINTVKTMMHFQRFYKNCHFWSAINSGIGQKYHAGMSSLALYPKSGPNSDLKSQLLHSSSPERFLKGINIRALCLQAPQV